MSIKEKVIVVTGGNSGIGKGIVKDLIMKDAIVCALGRNKSSLEKLIGEVNSKRLKTYECDITDSDNVEKTFRSIKNDFGYLYGLVNNAGINPSRNTILETSSDDWNKTIETNLSGAFRCSKEAISQMVKNGEGSIVNISSIAGISGMEKRFAYSASKAAIVGISSSMAIDFAKDNIRVNCICPGYVETPLVSGYIKDLPMDKKEILVSSHLLGRLGSVSDIASAVSFLISDEASWITGAILPVDGGYTLGKNSQ